LLTAPAGLALNTGTSIFWRSLMNMGLAAAANPLVQGERHQAFKLASHAIHHVTEINNAEARIDLCAAAFLQNREEDEGRRLVDSHWVARVIYALGASTFHLCESVEQGAAYAALTGTVVRHFGKRNPDAMAAMGQALGIGETPAVPLVADVIDACFAKLGFCNRLRDLGVPHEMLPAILNHSLQNFNADANREFLNETERLAKTLDAAW
jgi:alcohol dehydrogenase class IV